MSRVQRPRAPLRLPVRQPNTHQPRAASRPLLQPSPAADSSGSQAKFPPPLRLSPDDSRRPVHRSLPSSVFWELSPSVHLSHESSCDASLCRTRVLCFALDLCDLHHDFHARFSSPQGVCRRVVVVVFKWQVFFELASFSSCLSCLYLQGRSTGTPVVTMG